MIFAAVDVNTAVFWGVTFCRFVDTFLVFEKFVVPVIGIYFGDGIWWVPLKCWCISAKLYGIVDSWAVHPDN
jgi:hypothetical protein